MSKEIKKYTIATFSYRDGRFRKIKSRDEGIRLIDWVRENSPVDLHTLADLTEQALALLSGRETAGQDEMRGFVSPFIFIVNREGELRLLDLTDESNRAIARKAQSDGVGQFFSPPDKSACTREQVRCSDSAGPASSFWQPERRPASRSEGLSKSGGCALLRSAPGRAGERFPIWRERPTLLSRS